MTVSGSYFCACNTRKLSRKLFPLPVAPSTSVGYALNREHVAPDFHCVGPLGDFFVEATTVNPSDTPPEVNEDNREQYFSEYVPIKFGSALRSKLVKRYWELPHV